MIQSWIAARDRAASAVDAGSESDATAGFRAMAAMEAAACNASGNLTDRLALALLVAEADSHGDELGPAWDIVRAVLRDLSASAEKSSRAA